MKQKKKLLLANLLQRRQTSKPAGKHLLLFPVRYLLSGLPLLFLLIYVSQSCKSPTSPANGGNENHPLNLSVVDISCTEAWLKLENKAAELPLQINLVLNGASFATINLTTNDTVLYADSLQPNQTYRFQVFGIENTATSNELSLTTLDTTSNNFTWQTFTFGEHSSSILRDVAIIDENNIYAVGEIYLNDSTGQPDLFHYNLAQWNGREWKLKKISVDYKGNKTIAPLTGIFALPDGKIILSSGIPYLPDGNGGWKLYHLWDMGVLNQNDGSVNHIWGTSINDLYFAGNKGTIVHYHNGNWSKIESGTTTIINDVWGVKNSLILAAVSDRWHRGDYKLLSIYDETVSDFNWPFTRLYGVWFNSDREIYVVGDGVHLYKNGLWKTLNITSYFTTRVKGNALNDVFITGCCNTLIHFNGVNWKTMDGIYGNYEGLDVKGNLAVAVGWTTNKAIIVMGKRQ